MSLRQQARDAAIRAQMNSHETWPHRLTAIAADAAALAVLQEVQRGCSADTLDGWIIELQQPAFQPEPVGEPAPPAASGDCANCGHPSADHSRGSCGFLCLCPTFKSLIATPPAEPQPPVEPTLEKIEMPKLESRDSGSERREYWLMECMACFKFGTPMSKLDVICGNCLSRDTRIWTRTEQTGSVSVSTAKPADGRAGAGSAEKHTIKPPLNSLRDQVIHAGTSLQSTPYLSHRLIALASARYALTEAQKALEQERNWDKTQGPEYYEGFAVAEYVISSLLNELGETSEATP